MAIESRPAELRAIRRDGVDAHRREHEAHVFADQEQRDRERDVGARPSRAQGEHQEEAERHRDGDGVEIEERDLVQRRVGEIRDAERERG
jgi:hypothetical protein